MKTINSPYFSPYGLWKVTTYGDREDKSVSDLGVFRGYIDEIAYALADRAMYSLRFKSIAGDVPTPTHIVENVNISLDVDSGTWDWSNKELTSYFCDMLRDRPNVEVQDCNYFASVTLHFTDNREMERKIALSKLTDREKHILGL